MKRNLLILLCLFSIIVTSAQLPAGKPALEIRNYYGDLSILLQNERIEWDPCVGKFKVYYNLSVKNDHGNIPFTFIVKFELYDQHASFFFTDGSNTANEVFNIINLDINQTRNANIYIYSSSFHDLEGPDIKFSAKIYEYKSGGRFPVYYKINEDISDKRNNISTAYMEIPYSQTDRKTEFDDFVALNMPASTNELRNLYEPEFFSGLIGTCGNHLVANPGNGLAGIEPLGRIIFEKITCLKTGIPIYYIKKGNNYLTANVFDGSIILSNSPIGIFSQWVFTKAPSNLAYPACYIYNVGYGKDFRMQMDPAERESCLRNQIFMYPVNTAQRDDDIFYY